MYTYILHNIIMKTDIFKKFNNVSFAWGRFNIYDPCNMYLIKAPQVLWEGFLKTMPDCEFIVISSVNKHLVKTHSKMCVYTY